MIHGDATSSQADDKASQAIRNDPRPSSGTTLRLIAPPTPQRSLFLTPVENDVWQAMVGKTKEVEHEHRFGVPQDLTQLYREGAAEDLVADPEEYGDVLTRFADANIVSEMPGSAPSRRAYRWNFRPGHFRVIPISVRKDAPVDGSWLAIIRAIESGAFQPPTTRSFTSAFKDWISAQYPDVNPDTARSKLVYYNPVYANQCMGVIARDDVTKAWLIAVPGFEAYAFRLLAEDTKPSRETVLEQENRELNIQVRGLKKQLKESNERGDKLRRDWDAYLKTIGELIGASVSRKKK